MAAHALGTVLREALVERHRSRRIGMATHDEIALGVAAQGLRKRTQPLLSTRGTASRIRCRRGHRRERDQQPILLCVTVASGI